MMANEVRTYFRTIGESITTLWDGMRVTMHHFTRKKRLNATLQYPRERWPLPNRNIGFEESQYNVIRSRLHVDIDDCIGCMQCERACPVSCIKIETIKIPKDSELGTLPGSTQTSATSQGSPKRLLVTRFD
ncbi:MAG: 4Fe-4S binding protein, partial [Fidelibacterota bacterium]